MAKKQSYIEGQVLKVYGRNCDCRLYDLNNKPFTLSLDREFLFQYKADFKGAKIKIYAKMPFPGTNFTLDAKVEVLNPDKRPNPIRHKPIPFDKLTFKR